ncbi:HVO_A0556 family zinc finger protein [Natrinema caseinilyticum]|uniref:HVO_A0556 family zinc finger protein n=1 Tax=Natrinema caseinilyticum TaxID=2961570 RepID=UPI0030F47615
MHVIERRSNDSRLLSRLEGEECQYCASGTLERGTYKGNLSMVCSACETPQIQLW